MEKKDIKKHCIFALGNFNLIYVLFARSPFESRHH